MKALTPLRYLLTRYEIHELLVWRRTLEQDGSFHPSVFRGIDRSLEDLRVKLTLLYKDLPACLKSKTTSRGQHGSSRTSEPTSENSGIQGPTPSSSESTTISATHIGS